MSLHKQNATGIEQLTVLSRWWGWWYLRTSFSLFPPTGVVLMTVEMKRNAFTDDGRRKRAIHRGCLCWPLVSTGCNLSLTVYLPACCHLDAADVLCPGMQKFTYPPHLFDCCRSEAEQMPWVAAVAAICWPYQQIGSICNHRLIAKSLQTVSEKYLKGWKIN